MEFLFLALKFLAGLVAAIGLYFFIVTRLAVAIKTAQQKPGDPSDTLYWLYTNKTLIKITDNQLVTSAVLLFQYNRLVRQVLSKMDSKNKDGRVLQISCAYGNFSEKFAQKCQALKAGEMVICDIVGNQLDNVKRKITPYSGKTTLVEEDAVSLRFKTAEFQSALIFFLLHELPFAEKQKALSEAMRVIKPGGKLILAEFHKPRNLFLRGLVKAYFFLFEPFALDMWGRFNPAEFIEKDQTNGWQIQKEGFFWDNFQVVSATKLAPKS